MIEFVKSVSNLFNQNDIDYLIVGSVAQLIYGEKVNPADLDIWIRNNSQNIIRLRKVITNNVFIEDFKSGKIIRVIGKPYSIDLHPKLDGLKLSEIRLSNQSIKIKGVNIKVLQKDGLRKNLETTKKLVHGAITK